ncbi:hypothetical protein BDB01DRAFT_836103 [Pilobolus umbonatus]|nr:hypothetical protein BDB01DRAFT_836103 [Pilobolus umbonatus]
MYNGIFLSQRVYNTPFIILSELVFYQITPLSHTLLQSTTNSAFINWIFSRNSKRQRNSLNKHTNTYNSDTDAILRLEEMVRQLKKENEAVKESFNCLKKEHNKLKVEYDTVVKKNIELEKKVQETTIQLEEQKEQSEWYFDVTEEQSTELIALKKEQKKDKKFIKKLQEYTAVLVEDNLLGKEEYRSLSLKYSLYQVQKFEEKDEDEELLAEYRKQVDDLMEVNNLLHQSIDLVTEKYEKALEDLESTDGLEMFMVKEVEKEIKKNKQ